MDWLRKFDIACVGLKEGVHKFQFHVDERFFDNFNESLVKNGEVEVKLLFEKHPSFFMLNFRFYGTLQLPCDRCGVKLDYPIDNDDSSVVVKFDEHREGDKDDSNADVIYISRNDTHLNVGQLIYEFISLSIPVNHVNCDNIEGKKPCDEQVLTQLRTAREQKQTVDHRWDDLQKIKFN